MKITKKLILLFAFLASIGCVEALPVVTNAQDNAMSTAVIFLFAAVVYALAWPFRYLPMDNDKTRTRVSKATAWMPFESFTPYMRIGHAFSYATWFVGYFFLWLTNNQVKWTFFLMAVSFGLSLFVDKFVWYKLVTSGNHNFGIASLGLLSLIPDAVAVVLWAIFNFRTGCGGCGDVPISNLGFGITGVVLYSLWVIYRIYTFGSLITYFYYGEGQGNPINASGRTINHPQRKNQ